MSDSAPGASLSGKYRELDFDPALLLELEVDPELLLAEADPEVVPLPLPEARLGAGTDVEGSTADVGMFVGPFIHLPMYAN